LPTLATRKKTAHAPPSAIMRAGTTLPDKKRKNALKLLFHFSRYFSLILTEWVRPATNYAQYCTTSPVALFLSALAVLF